MTLYYSIFIVILLVNIFFSINNRPKQKFAYLLVLFLVILFGGNTLNPDYNVYYMHYVGVTAPFSEIGYNMLVSFSRKIGFSYNTFLFFVASIGYILILKSVKRYISNVNAFFVFYAFYPFLFDVVQIRNFIILSILVYSLKYLVEDIKYWKMKYIALMIIASLFQITAIVYLPLILIRGKNQRHIIRVIIFISILFSLVFLIDSSIIIDFMNFSNSFIDDKRIAIWFNRSTNFGFLYNWALQFVNLLFCKLLYISHCRGNNTQLIGNLDLTVKNKQKRNCIIVNKILSVVYWINIYATIFLPFYIMASVFDRFMRNLMLVNYIAIICWGEQSNISKRTKLQFIFCYLIYILFLVIMNILVFNPNLAAQILLNNLLF